LVKKEPSGNFSEDLETKRVEDTAKLRARSAARHGVIEELTANAVVCTQSPEDSWTLISWLREYSAEVRIVLQNVVALTNYQSKHLFRMHIVGNGQTFISRRRNGLDLLPNSINAKVPACRIEEHPSRINLPIEGKASNVGGADIDQSEKPPIYGWFVFPNVKDGPFKVSIEKCRFK
jgi:hypothetical protein